MQSCTLKKVLVTEILDQSAVDILQKNGIELVSKIGMSKEELLKEIPDYDGLIVRSATKVTADVIEAGKKLCVIGRAGTGVDNIDVDAASKRGIMVMNTPAGNSLSAAELTCGMLIAVSRNIAQGCTSLKSGKWERKNFMGNELYGKTLGIIGLGRIGREVATRMQTFQMRTIGYDPLVSPEVAAKFNIEFMELEQIWPLVDYITVHTPLIPATKDLINDDVFAKCKKGVKIVNCARGGIINEDALLRALESGQCGGAGLDVFMEEPPKNRALVEHPKVACTPHLGASTVEAQKRVAQEISEQFVDLTVGNFVVGLVNAPLFCEMKAAYNAHWVTLCQYLGAILANFVENTEGSIHITVAVHGHDIQRKGDIAKGGTLIGFLKQKKYNANEVNYLRVAEEHSVKITTVNVLDADESIKPNTIVVTLQSEGKTNKVMGTVRDSEPLLTNINGVEFENPARLVGQPLLCHGQHGAEFSSKLIGTVLENGTISSIHWSSVSDGYTWCLVNGNFTLNSLPDLLQPYVKYFEKLDI